VVSGRSDVSHPFAKRWRKDGAPASIREWYERPVPQVSRRSRPGSFSLDQTEISVSGQWSGAGSDVSHPAIPEQHTTRASILHRYET